MLEVERSVTGGESRLTFRGKLTVADAAGVRMQILETVSGAGSSIVLHLAGVTFLDSSGVAILVEGWRAAREAGKAYLLAAPSPAVMRVLELSQLDRIFHIEGGP